MRNRCPTLSPAEVKKTHARVSRKEFDAWAVAKEFDAGPWREAFGDGYGEPYNPNRIIFGTLKDGRKVYSILDWEDS